ncbi:MAG: hypothetical protein ACP5TO_07030 [Thermoplasmata archaeon]
MKVHSGHIYLSEKLDWKDLKKVFPEMFKLFLEESRQTFEEPNFVDILIYENMLDLDRNRKPEGFIRDGKMKMLFSKDGGIEIKIIRDKVVPNEDTKAVTEQLSHFLTSKKIRNRVEYDKMFWIELKKRKK